jgi:hypothetical protein
MSLSQMQVFSDYIMAMVGATAQKAEQDKRHLLEQRLTASEQTHFEKLTNAQKDQDRLRDRLATSDLRLSVLLARLLQKPDVPG